MLSLDAPILLVDDSLAAQQSLLTALGTAGYTNIHVANNGKEALDKILSAQEINRMFKVIFLDWNMPEMDGLAFLKTCRGDLKLKDVAIIMLTAFTDQKSLILALGSGATTFMTKPVSNDAILKKLGQIGDWMEN